MSGIWKGGKRIYMLLNLKTFFNIKIWNKAWIPPYNARSGSSLNSGWQKKSIFPPIPQLVGNLHCVTQETAKTEKTLDPLHLPLTTLQSFNWIFMKFPNLKYPLFGLFSSSNWRPCIAGCFDYPWTVARSNGKSNSNVESNLEIKLGFPHTTPLPDWLLSECNNFTQFLLDVYVCIFSNLQCFECLAAVFHIDCTLDRWRLEIKCFIPWKLLCFGNIMMAHQNNLKVLGE